MLDYSNAILNNNNNNNNNDNNNNYYYYCHYNNKYLIWFVHFYNGSSCIKL